MANQKQIEPTRLEPTRLYRNLHPEPITEEKRELDERDLTPAYNRQTNLRFAVQTDLQPER
jgi:hypothetical protein